MIPAPSDTPMEQPTGWLHGVMTIGSAAPVDGLIGATTEKTFPFYTDTDNSSDFSLTLMFLQAQPDPYPTYVDSTLVLTLSPSMPCRLTYSQWDVDPLGVDPDVETVLTFDFTPATPTITITASGEFIYYNQFSLARLF